jgi:two-component system nitrogen regulation response regulator NtrX
MLSSGKEILIVDDEVNFRLLLAEILVEQGYRVTTAHNGKEALRHLELSGKSPDLITIDVNMPETDGIALQEQISKINPGIPLVMISGSLPKHLSLITGICAYLLKPLNKMELLRVLKKHI